MIDDFTRNGGRLLRGQVQFPKDEQSLLDLTRLPEGSDHQIQANITIQGDSPLPTMPAAASREALYGSCTDEVAA